MTLKMNKIYITFLLLLTGNVLFGQENSTGSKSLNFPIYTLKEGGLVVPISLSYDGSGVKVAEQPSTVGQNWQLNAGGFIMRETRGKPDEMVEIF